MMGAFRYISLNKPSDWEQGIVHNVRISHEGITLQQKDQYAIAKKIPLNGLKGAAAIEDVALGQQGRIYLLDAAAGLWMYNPDNLHLESLLPHGHGAFGPSAQIAAAGDVVLVADPAGPTPLLAYSAFNGQIIWSYSEYSGESLIPLAVTESLGVFLVLALVGETLLYTLRFAPSGQLLDEKQVDRSVLFGLSGPEFESFWLEAWGEGDGEEDEREAESRPSGAGEPDERLSRALQHSFEQKLKHWRSRLQLGFIEKQAGLLLDAATGKLCRLQDGSVPDWFAAQSASDIHPTALATDRHGRVFIGCGAADGTGEEERFLLHISSAAEGGAMDRVPSFHARADKLLTDERGRVYAWDRAEGAITMLRLTPLTRPGGGVGQYDGVWLSYSLDSTHSENEWHKVMLDADVHEGMQIRLSWFASDRKSVLIGSQYVDLDELIANPAQTTPEKLALLRPLWTRSITNPKDALLTAAKGRYLWLKLEFIGNETDAPLLRRLRVYDPRMSYLSYLPAIYQEDDKSRDFLERYLSMYATFMEETDENIADVSRYFDAEAAEGPYLRWLASWLGILADEHWNEHRLRLWIQEAPFLYRYRGTRAAIERMVQIYTGESPMIVEHFQIRHLLENAESRETASRLYSEDPYTFCVLVKPEQVPTDKHQYILQQLLDSQKPAFTEAKLVVLQPWMNMDMHTYLGINTTLAEPTLLKLDQHSTLPYHTLLTDVGRDNRMDIHTRLGLDSKLE